MCCLNFTHRIVGKVQPGTIVNSALKDITVIQTNQEGVGLVLVRRLNAISPILANYCAMALKAALVVGAIEATVVKNVTTVILAIPLKEFLANHACVT